MSYWLQVLFWVVFMAGAGLALRPLINRDNRSGQ